MIWLSKVGMEVGSQPAFRFLWRNNGSDRVAPLSQTLRLANFIVF